MTTRRLPRPRVAGRRRTPFIDAEPHRHGVDEHARRPAVLRGGASVHEAPGRRRRGRRGAAPAPTSAVAKWCGETRCAYAERGGARWSSVERPSQGTPVASPPCGSGPVVGRGRSARGAPRRARARAEAPRRGRRPDVRPRRSCRTGSGRAGRRRCPRRGVRAHGARRARGTSRRRGDGARAGRCTCPPPPRAGRRR